MKDVEMLFQAPSLTSNVAHLKQRGHAEPTCRVGDLLRRHDPLSAKEHCPQPGQAPKLFEAVLISAVPRSFRFGSGSVPVRLRFGYGSVPVRLRFDSLIFIGNSRLRQPNQLSQLSQPSQPSQLCARSYRSKR